MNVEVFEGDIAERSAGAIVNATNTSLQMNGEVATAVRDAAGRGITPSWGPKTPSNWGRRWSPTRTS